MEKPNLKWVLENVQGLCDWQKAGRHCREYSSNWKQGGGTKPTTWEGGQGSGHDGNGGFEPLRDVGWGL